MIFSMWLVYLAFFFKKIEDPAKKVTKMARQARVDKQRNLEQCKCSSSSRVTGLNQGGKNELEGLSVSEQSLVDVDFKENEGNVTDGTVVPYGDKEGDAHGTDVGIQTVENVQGDKGAADRTDRDTNR